ncbi:MAG: hypothetical protein HW386_1174 [Gammaproteobacteria bacterium]|nr:hypothetical protein [Gammaproteobacteria bacterium]
MRKLLSGLLVLMAGNVSGATDLYIYPNNGQDEELQRHDRYECHVWAAGQTGFDPSNYQAPQPVIYPPVATRHNGGFGSDPVTGAAKGAAVGAVGGAIGGNVGKGAAIGAGVGALLGAFRTLERESDREELDRQREVTEQQVEIDNLRADYNRAISACLEGRGYTVK